MKKTIIAFHLILLPIIGITQVWVEGFSLYSFPSKDWMASGSRTIEIIASESITVPNKELFTYLADPQFGGGLNVRYARKRLIVGMEGSYLSYKPTTDYLQIKMFRVGPIIEYFIFKGNGNVQPYFGGEFGIQQSTVKYNRELTDRLRIDDTHFGIGPRLGVVFKFNDKLACRLGCKYIYMETLPFFDVSAGLAFNLGDF